ncbi:MAG: SDR family oxidoreductase [Bacteroidetes bacterium]|nr:SDR family oxidoreductase [Bacteroidota bacterium]
MNPEVYWITGASSGIGKALALELAKPGNAIILSGRNVQALEEVKQIVLLKGAGCESLPFNVADIEKFPEIVKQAIGVFGHIDVLVNNAGVSQRSPAMQTSSEVEKELMHINYFSPVALSKELIPHLRERGIGHIVVVSSIAGKFGFSLRSTYAAAKHALHGYFEALRLELREIPVYVTIVCPGRVKTNVSFNALQGDGRPHAVMDDGQRKGISAGTCAKRMAKAIKNKNNEVLIGGAELIPVYLRRYCPPLFYYLIKKVKPT